MVSEAHMRQVTKFVLWSLILMAPRGVFAADANDLKSAQMKREGSELIERCREKGRRASEESRKAASLKDADALAKAVDGVQSISEDLQDCGRRLADYSRDLDQMRKLPKEVEDFGAWSKKFEEEGRDRDRWCADMKPKILLLRAALASLSVDPASVLGGGTAQGRVTLSGPAPAGKKVTLASDNHGVTVPPIVTVPAGQSGASFTINTAAVSANTTVNITATLGKDSRKAALTVTAPVKPSVAIASPAAGAKLSGSVVLTAKTSGNVNVAYTLDGSGYLDAVLTASPFSFTWDTTKVPNGAHTLTAGAWDATSRQWVAGSAPVAVTVNNAVKPSSAPAATPPAAPAAAASVAIVSPVSGATVSGTVSLTAKTTGNVNVAYTLDGSGYLDAVLTNPPYTFAWDTTQVANGTHKLTAGAWDATTRNYAAGSAVVTITVNNAAKPAPVPVPTPKPSTGTAPGGTPSPSPSTGTASGASIAPAACVVRNDTASLPNATAPNVGSGYAKQNVASQASCTDAVYAALQNAYCASGANQPPVQWEYALYDSNGNFKTTGCAASGCNSHPCPSK
jgi:hypothetical protein